MGTPPHCFLDNKGQQVVPNSKLQVPGTYAYQVPGTLPGVFTNQVPGYLYSTGFGKWPTGLYWYPRYHADMYVQRTIPDALASLNL